MTDRPLMLLDSASMYFRAFYGVPESVTAPDGTPVNAARGFVDMIARLVTERRPARLVACLDLDWRPAFRVDALPSYKAHRVADGTADEVPAGVPEEVPDALAPQVPIILDVLAAAGIATGGAEGHEADDVIGTLAHQEDTEPVLAVSGDRDLMQIVREQPTPVRLLYVGRGLNKAEHLGPAEVATKYGVPIARAGEAYAEMAMLRGDPSDGLPGVPGVGEKTAATLVGRFDTWAELVAAVPTAPTPGSSPPCAPRWRRRRTTWPSSSRSCGWRWPRRWSWTATPCLPVVPANRELLEALAARWGLESSVQRLRTALEKAAM